MLEEGEKETEIEPVAEPERDAEGDTEDVTEPSGELVGLPVASGERDSDTDGVALTEGEGERLGDPEAVVVCDAEVEGDTLEVGQRDTELVSFRERDAVLVEEPDCVTRAAVVEGLGLLCEGVADWRVEAEGASGEADTEGLALGDLETVVEDEMDTVADTVLEEVVVLDTEGEADREGLPTGDAVSDAEPPNMTPPLKARFHWVAECVGDSDSVPVALGEGVFLASSTVAEAAALRVEDAEGAREALVATVKEAQPEGRAVPECEGDREPPPIKASSLVGKGAIE